MTQQPQIIAIAVRAVQAATAYVNACVSAGLVSTVMLVGASIGSAAAAAEASTESGTEQAGPIGELSDAQLTDLAADWEQLDAAARADLIAETRGRMQPGHAKTPQASSPSTTSASSTGVNSAGASQNTSVPKVTVRTERRRYGRVVRQPDGSLVRIETQVLRVQRSDPKRAFGVGFERRQRQHRPSGTQAGTPVGTTVSTEAQAPLRGEALPTDPTRQDVLVVSETLD